jgi:hypothetical protein
MTPDMESMCAMAKALERKQDEIKLLKAEITSLNELLTIAIDERDHYIRARDAGDRHIATLREALIGVISVADRKTVEFDSAREALKDKPE